MAPRPLYDPQDGHWKDCWSLEPSARGIEKIIIICPKPMRGLENPLLDCTSHLFGHR
ncbi:hypothetical protein HAX54_052897, partial [Datura stramonium]|nr:hypothetical protein [Datura stramonium]